jgi:hypothetical protein
MKAEQQKQRKRNKLLTFILCSCSNSSPTQGGGLALVFKSISPSRAAVYKHN